MDFEKAGFQPCKEWVKKMRDSGKSWEEIDLLCSTADNMDTMLEEHIEGSDAWPDILTVSMWHEFVKYYKSVFLPVQIQGGSDSVAGIDTGKNNDFSEFSSFGSTWLKYKATLSQKMSADSIGKLEKSCKWVLNHLSLKTKESGPVKGLVTGSVQSGKTANMVGLISMAADYDWNFFIILSGTIDNLRIQTRDRFASDLQNCEGILWRVIDFSGTDKAYCEEDLKLNPLTGNKSFSNRYVTVCLKNAKRLASLIDWLYNAPARTGKLRIVIIDDEADQASINTCDITEDELQKRNAINQLIVNLVNGRKSDGSLPSVPLQAINYISYTATPYANVLNESPGVSLYPSNFICSLPESEEYFGSRIIFGNGEEEYPGLGITREIMPDDVKKLKAGSDLPDSLKSAIAWFLSVCAAQRINNIKKIFSMLVHTSAKQKDHFRIYELIRSWLKTTPIDFLIDFCRKIYDEEKEKVTIEDIKAANPKYNTDLIKTTQYPSFNVICPELRELLNEITNIQLDDDNSLSYTNGLHLCVDNCAANKWAEEGTRLRIVYPNKEQLASLEKAPAFLVIGGNTLSRGLTIEGLVCSYFSRDVNQADTLMQMARWFGYKSDFEVLQRVWLTKAVQNKFEALARIDTALKLEVERFMEMGLSPKQFGPKINLIPEIAKFRITAMNRMQRAVPCELDFSGYSYETTDFDEDNDTIVGNYNLALACISKMQAKYHRFRSEVTKALVWTGVPVEFVKNDILKNYSISQQSYLHTDIQYFFEWLSGMNENGQLLEWDVALVDGENKDGTIIIDGTEYGAVERTRKINVSHIDIGSLRSGLDALSDVYVEALNDDQKKILQKAKKDKKDLISVRGKLNLEDKPLLLLYRIKKDGGQPKSGREKLKNLPCDLFGICIIISGDSSNKSHIQAVHVAIKQEENNQ